MTLAYRALMTFCGASLAIACGVVLNAAHPSPVEQYAMMAGMLSGAGMILAAVVVRD